MADDVAVPTGRDEAFVRNALARLRLGALALEAQTDAIVAAGRLVADTLLAGGTVLVCGNGGSAAAAQHFAAEFTGKLALDRRALPAVALHADTSALTAIANDWSFDEVYARQVAAFAGGRAVLVGLSTSGASRNVRAAMATAAELGVPTIALTGAVNRLGGDVQIAVPLRETARVQELHDLVLHEIAQIAERLVVPELDDDASADRFPFVLEDDDVARFADWIARSGQTLATTNGVFDLLHEGHLASLADMRAHGDRLVVLVNTDESTRRLKGETRPVRSLAERVADLRRSDLVDHVVVMDGDGPAGQLAVLRPAVHGKGEEYRERSLPEAAAVEGCGGRIEYLVRRPGLSTTAIVARIRA